MNSQNHEVEVNFFCQNQLEKVMHHPHALLMHMIEELDCQA